MFIVLNSGCWYLAKSQLMKREDGFCLKKLCWCVDE